VHYAHVWNSCSMNLTTANRHNYNKTLASASLSCSGHCSHLINAHISRSEQKQ